jgi:Raf kinase inhibitor-like YbhB/YbcL family protein
MRAIFNCTVLFFLPIFACHKEKESFDTSEELFMIFSNSFENNEEIPLRHICQNQGGENISPQLTWINSPLSGSFALVMDDEVSPCGTGENACRHWSVFNIPPETTTLPEGVSVPSLDGAIEGLNYSQQPGYAGPCPPSAHEYTISLYALSDSMPVIEEGMGYTRSQFEQLFLENILEETSLVGLFTPQ